MAQKFEVVTTVDVLDITGELSEAESLLLARAQAATQKAYAPYSGFLVGAAVLLEDGSIHTGNNQENAAYPSGLCAERTALFGLRANNPDIKIKMIAVTARKNGTDSFVAAMPCGSCRQVIAEYENHQKTPIAVLMQAGQHQAYRCPSAGHLLPLQFTKEHL
jgi:cytidine deaminase